MFGFCTSLSVTVDKLMWVIKIKQVSTYGGKIGVVEYVAISSLTVGYTIGKGSIKVLSSELVSENVAHELTNNNRLT